MKTIFNMAAALLVAMCIGCDQGSGSKGSGGSQISVLSNPEGAKVVCNGKTYGLTPTSIQNLGPGSYLVEVQKEGFSDALKTVQLLNNQRDSVEFTLEPVTGLVLIHSDPPGAAVEIAGASRGETPLLLTEFPLGEHRVTMNKRGFLPKEVIMTVAGKRPVKVSEALVSNSATVIFTSLPLGADIDIDGIRRGRTPATINDVSSGRHKIEITMAGYYKYEEEVTVSPGDQIDIDAPLRAIPGSLRVETTPAGAKVYVNNELRGTSPEEITDLTPGDYVVSVELKGFSSDRRVVSVGNGQAKVEEFRLIKNSGIIEIVTRPAGVNVFIDGELVGTTQAGRSDVISAPMRFDFLAKGAHEVQLTKEGFVTKNLAVEVTPDVITPVRGNLERIFIIDYEVITGTNADQHWKGRLVQKYDTGDVRLEMSPGVAKTFKAENILRHGPIRQSKPE